MTGVTEQQAAEALNKAEMHVKKAILILEADMDAEEATELLERFDGRLKFAIRNKKGQEE